jgi:hypothetical protein
MESNRADCRASLPFVKIFLEKKKILSIEWLDTLKSAIRNRKSKIGTTFFVLFYKSPGTSSKIKILTH